MTNIKDYMDEAEFYEEKFGGEPRSQKIKKSKPKTEESSDKHRGKRNKFDKKNAQKAPWKNEF